MNSGRRPSQRRVLRWRPSLLEELTDEVEPDEGLDFRRRISAMLVLVVTVALLAAGAAFVIINVLTRPR